MSTKNPLAKYGVLPEIPPLPAKNEYQMLRRDAQMKHQALWTAYCLGDELHVPTTPGTYARIQLREIQATKSFWSDRGYRIRTKGNKERTVLTVWLEKKA